MHIIVCVKQIPDPETSVEFLKIDETKQVILAPKVKLLMSPFDEQAVEAALRIRDAHSATTITVLSFGGAAAIEVIRHGLAMGADEGVLLSDRSLAETDSFATALALSKAIRKLAPYDLILAGRQAADWDAGIVGSGIAELLGLPIITFAKDVRIVDTAVRVERALDDGIETLAAHLPAVVTVSNELGQPRYPVLRQVMRAARKQITTWSAADLGIDANDVSPRLVLEELSAFTQENHCELIAGETNQELALNLVQRLREGKVL